jgi:poly(hydroxyalkanoate) depolymerase family esterase
MFGLTGVADAATASVSPWTQYVSGSGFTPSWAQYLPGARLFGSSTRGGGSTLTPTGYSGSGSTSASAPAAAAPGQAFSGTFSNSSGSLDYTGYVPTSYNGSKAVPLVVALHGCTETADGFRQLTRWDQLAEVKGFIVVFPQQSKDNNYLSCWNWFQSGHMQRGSGEPSLIAGVTQWAQQHYSIDTRRTYVSGFSAGGAMSSVMAATYPDLYAAAGIQSGCEYAATAACAGSKGADPAQAAQQAAAAMGTNKRPMPVILFQGDQDTIVPPANADQLAEQWRTTDDLVDDGAKNGSMSAFPTKTSFGQVQNGRFYTVKTYSDGHKNELIQYWLVRGMGHAWSGGCDCEQYADPSGPDATGAMYTFFTNHPMP